MDKRFERCPICLKGNLSPREHARDSEIDGHRFQIAGLLHSVCDHCGERVTTPDQSRHNKKVLIEARARAVVERDHAHALKPADVLQIRKKLGLTQAQAFRVFGGGTNAFSKYENGEVVPSDAMERLLRLADSIPAAARWLLSRAGVLPELAEDASKKTKPTFISAVERVRKAHRGTRITYAAYMGKGVSVSVAYGHAVRPGRKFTYAPDAANDPRMPSKVDLVNYG